MLLHYDRFRTAHGQSATHDSVTVTLVLPCSDMLTDAIMEDPAVRLWRHKVECAAKGLKTVGPAATGRTGRSQAGSTGLALPPGKAATPPHHKANVGGTPQEALSGYKAAMREAGKAAVGGMASCPPVDLAEAASQATFSDFCSRVAHLPVWKVTASGGLQPGRTASVTSVPPDGFSLYWTALLAYRFKEEAGFPSVQFQRAADLQQAIKVVQDADTGSDPSHYERVVAWVDSSRDNDHDAFFLPPQLGPKDTLLQKAAQQYNLKMAYWTGDHTELRLRGLVSSTGLRRPPAALFTLLELESLAGSDDGLCIMNPQLSAGEEVGHFSVLREAASTAAGPLTLAGLHQRILVAVKEVHGLLREILKQQCNE